MAGQQKDPPGEESCRPCGHCEPKIPTAEPLGGTARELFEASGLIQNPKFLGWAL